MRFLPSLGALVLSLLPAATLVAGEVVFRSGTSRVALIELYTSEGCSSCPPAEQWLGDLRQEKGLWQRFVPVAFHVNYWDRLGWRDVLASKPFTDRQHDYAAQWGSDSVYTPCFVRDGAEWRPDGKPGLESPGKADAGEVTLAWLGEGNKCRISYMPASGEALPRRGFAGAVALLGSEVRHEIRAGENAGRRLRHDFVALRLETIRLEPAADGAWSAVVTLPPRPEIVAGRLAIAGWVTRAGDRVPLQATGGWLAGSGKL